MAEPKTKPERQRTSPGRRATFPFDRAPARWPDGQPAAQNSGAHELTSWVLPETSRYRGWRLLCKRAFDIATSLLALLVLIPFFVLLTFAVKTTSRGPLFFRQDRAGQGGRAFPMYKFRSMYPDAEARLVNDPELFQQYVENDYKLPEFMDPRVTPLGRFLRKSSLDELPQLWSVVRGHMSMVGPRPVVFHELHAERTEDAYVYARPGITGSWQVQARSNVGYPERCEFDNEYVEQWSLWRDISLLLRTIPAVLRGRGAH